MISQLNVSKRSIGVTFNANREAEIVLWAPWATTVAIKLYRDSIILPLTSIDSGYWQLTTDQLKAGDLYSFLLNDDLYADMASLAQPQGLYGPSQAVNTSDFYWEETGCWVNPPIDEYTVHEVDLNTFTTEGTLNAVISKLTELKSQGINAIRIKPVTPFLNSADKPTDNDCLFAVPPTYGGYRQLQHLVNACHYEGVAVIMEIAYTTTFHHKIELASADEREQARRHYLIENALMWFRDFHIDAIQLEIDKTRLDMLALVAEIRSCANALTAINGHHYYLLVEQEVAKNECDKTYLNDYLYDEEFAQALQELFHKKPGDPPAQLVTDL